MFVDSLKFPLKKSIYVFIYIYLYIFIVSFDTPSLSGEHGDSEVLDEDELEVQSSFQTNI